MIEAEVRRDRAGRITFFRVQGHAGPAESWKALVCAAASTLSQTAVLGLENVLGLRPRVEIRDGYLSCALPPDLGEAERWRANDVLETMLAGLRALAETHPALVRVRDEGGEGTCGS